MKLLPKRLSPEIKKVPKQDWKAANETDKLNYKSKLEGCLTKIQLPQ